MRYLQNGKLLKRVCVESESERKRVSERMYMCLRERESLPPELVRNFQKGELLDVLMLDTTRPYACVWKEKTIVRKRRCERVSERVHN